MIIIISTSESQGRACNKPSRHVLTSEPPPKHLPLYDVVSYRVLGLNRAQIRAPGSGLSSRLGLIAPSWRMKHQRCDLMY